MWCSWNRILLNVSISHFLPTGVRLERKSLCKEHILKVDLGAEAREKHKRMTELELTKLTLNTTSQLRLPLEKKKSTTGGLRNRYLYFSHFRKLDVYAPSVIMSSQCQVLTVSAALRLSQDSLFLAYTRLSSHYVRHIVSWADSLVPSWWACGDVIGLGRCYLPQWVCLLWVHRQVDSEEVGPGGWTNAFEGDMGA